MATGYIRSIEGGHDVIYDYCCTTCEEENFNTEALYYCVDCSQQFCEPCKKAHSKFLRTHQVLGRKEVAKWGDVKPVTSSFMCDEHRGKELEMFCEDHDRLCCSICIGVKHRVCKEVKPMSEVAKGIRNNSRFKSFLSEAAKTQTGLKHLYDKQEENIRLLQKTKGEITNIFKDTRKQFNEIVDRLEEKSTKEMDKLLTMLKEKVTLSKTNCLDFHDKIEKFLHDIEDLGKQCDELAFQSYKKCCEYVTSADELLSSLQDVDYNLKFTPDAKIEQYLSSLETLGTFYVTPSGLFDSLQCNELTKAFTSPDHVYTVVNRQTYNVKTSGDTETCDVNGICQLPNGQTVIVDYNNIKVKLLSSSTFCVLDELKLPYHPRDICHTTGTELAVAVYDWRERQEIQFINAENGKLSHTRTIQLDHGYSGIACHNGQLHMSSNKAVYVYSLSGEKIKKLYEDTSITGTTVFRHSLNDDKSRIYVSNYAKHLLLTLDSLGNQLFTFSDPELQRPTDVCVADNGSVFVCGWKSHIVLQVDREGKRKMTTLATQADGVYKPRSICYASKSHALLVGQERNDNFLVLQLK